MTTGIAAVHLNRLLQLGFQGEEFACGLLHDFGRTLLAVADSDLFQQADRMTFEESFSICAEEVLKLKPIIASLAVGLPANQDSPNRLSKQSLTTTIRSPAGNIG